MRYEIFPDASAKVGHYLIVEVVRKSLESGTETKTDLERRRIAEENELTEYKAKVSRYLEWVLILS